MGPWGFPEAVQPLQTWAEVSAKKDVRARKTPHVLESSADPRDRLAAADRQGVEDTRGLFGIFDKRRKEWRLFPGLHPAQNVQVQPP